MNDQSAPDELDYIDDMLEAAEKIEQYTNGLSGDEFVADEKTVDAVLRNLEVIGEASKLVPQNLRERESDIPWNEMARMRDKLIHGYATIDLKIVWQTAIEDIPPLRSKLESLAGDLDSEQAKD